MSIKNFLSDIHLFTPTSAPGVIYCSRILSTHKCHRPDRGAVSPGKMQRKTGHGKSCPGQQVEIGQVFNYNHVLSQKYPVNQEGRVCGAVR